MLNERNHDNNHGMIQKILVSLAFISSSKNEEFISKKPVCCNATIVFIPNDWPISNGER